MRSFTAPTAMAPSHAPATGDAGACANASDATRRSESENAGSHVASSASTPLSHAPTYPPFLLPPNPPLLPPVRSHWRRLAPGLPEVPLELAHGQFLWCRRRRDVLIEQTRVRLRQVLLGNRLDDDLLAPAGGPRDAQLVAEVERRCGFALCPLTSTLPPLQACCASLRVLKRHATSSQTSRRTSSAPGLHPLNHGGCEAR